MGKYTNGPWRYRSAARSGAKGLYYYIETVDKSHSNTFIGDVGGGLQSKEEIKANAALISAAPDLLEALKVCYASLCTYGSHPIIEQQVEKAIRKAEGK